MVFNRCLGSAPVWTGKMAAMLRDVLRHPAILPTVGIAGILLSLLSSAVIRNWERTMAAEKAADLVHKQVEKLQETGLRSMEVLYSVASLYEAQGEINRLEFQKFVRQALARQPELRALSWNPRVLDSDRKQFESAARRDGMATFQVQELNPTLQLVTATKRAEYVPIYFIEPFAGNASALGYDLASDSCRRQSLEKARDSGQPAASAPVHLAQEHDRQPGLLVLLPVYRGPTPENVEARREQLAGFAVAVFRVADLAGNALNELERLGIHARLFDESTTGELIYASSMAGQKEPYPSPAPEASLQIAGRRWVVQFNPTASFNAAQPHDQSWLVLIAGLAITFLVTAYLYSGWKRALETARVNAALQEEVAVRKKAEAEAAAANQAKSDFLASMSHEIRTPLNAILGYTQLMQHDPELSPEQRDAIAGINCSSKHLIGLINEILDLSKIEAGRMALHPADFDLYGLGRSLISTFQPLCAQKRIGLRLLIEASQPARICGDEGKLRQILINLIGNAVKFTSAGEVCLGLKPQGKGHWLFEVVDTGMGIPEEEQADIFKPFHQGTNAAHQGGTGLGLAIAQRQVELLGGKLELQSERGAGSRFCFQLHFAPASSLEGVEQRPPGRPRLKPGCRVHALVVDDRKENRDVLGGMLTAAGCEVSLAKSGQEALELTRTLRCDIVFLDLLMPGMDGIATTRAILSDPACGRPIVAAHSAAAVPRNYEQALAAGCVEFMAKPIQAEQLYACLQTHLGVEFNYPSFSPTLEQLPPWLAGPVTLPAELQHRITTAAELHSTTALKICLQELRLFSPEAGILAEHIRHLMRSYDMDGILRLICDVTADTPAHHGLAAS